MEKEIDPSLTGYWRGVDWQVAQEMVGRTLRVIGGKPGELTEFTEDGLYIIHGRRPQETVEYHYRARPDCLPPELDLFMCNPDFTTHGIYQLEGDELTLAVSANGRARPEHADQEAPYRVLIRYHRARPRRRRSGSNSSG